MLCGGNPGTKRTVGLLGASRMLALTSWQACSPGVGGATPTPSSGAPPETSPPFSTLAPGIPAYTDGAETILIPAGTFWMGSGDSDTLADEDEMPRHQVALEPYLIYIHEETNEMHARFVAEGA